MLLSDASYMCLYYIYFLLGFRTARAVLEFRRDSVELKAQGTLSEGEFSLALLASIFGQQDGLLLKIFSSTL